MPTSATRRHPYLVAPNHTGQPFRVATGLDLTQHAEDVRLLRGAVAMLHLVVHNQMLNDIDESIEIDWVGVLTLVQDAETAALRATGVAGWLQDQDEDAITALATRRAAAAAG